MQSTPLAVAVGAGTAGAPDRACVTCGLRLAAGAIICVNCGTDQATGQTLTTTVAAPRRRLPLRDLVVGAVVIAVLGLIPLCGWFLLREQDRQAHAQAVAAAPRNVLAAKGRSFFLQVGIRISRTPGGPPLPTLGETARGVPPWIENNLGDPDLVAIPGSWSNTTLYFSGPVAAGRDLASALARVSAPGGDPDGRVTRIAEFARDLNPGRGGSPVVSAPFRHNPGDNRYELPLEGAFVAGQVLGAGSNFFACVAKGTQEEDTVTIRPEILIAQGRHEISSRRTSVLYCPFGPEIALLPLAPSEQRRVEVDASTQTMVSVEEKNPGRIVQSQVLVSGSYRSACGIRRAGAVLDGADWPVDPGGSKVAHEACQILLAGKPAQGAHLLNLVLEDLAGNVSTSKTVSFYFLPVAVTLRSSVQKEGTNLFLNLEITGIGEPGALPRVQSLLLFGRGAIPLASLTRAGTSAVLTNCPLWGHSGHNLFMAEAGVSVLTPGIADLSFSSTTDYYLNRLRPEDLPDLPSLGAIHPADEMLYGSGGAYAFDAGHPFWATYFDQSPGVDAANVHVLVRSATGGWQDVSDQFVFSETKAQLKPGGAFRLLAAHPQIKLLVPEKGYPTPSVFVKGYRLRDISSRKDPYIQTIRPFLLVKGRTVDIRLEGQNLEGVKELGFRSAAARGFSLGPMVTYRGSFATTEAAGESISKDALEFRVNPPACGPAYICLNNVTQEYAPLLVVDAIDPETLGYLVRNLPDVNGDGRVDALDLDSDGDGLPDLSLLLPALASMFRSYAPEAACRGSCIGTLGAWYLQIDNVREQETIRDLLWAATADPNARTRASAAAALLQAADRTGSVSRIALAQKALSMLADPACGDAAKVSAIRVCVALGATEVLPAVRGLAESGAPVPLRIEAVSAVGALGNSLDYYQLDRLAHNYKSSTALRMAAVSALDRLKR